MTTPSCPALPASLSSSFQIPVTQACLMEDIEKWLSTDVVSRGRPAQKQRLRPAPHPPDGAPRFLMRKRLVLGMTGGALLWDPSAAGSVPPLEQGLALHPSPSTLTR